MTREEEVGQRNSEYRELSESLLGRPVKLFHRRFRGVKADHVSIAGALFSMAGIHLMESQHRAQKYSPKHTLAAVGLVGVGMLLDLFDGKLARVIRQEMTEEKEKYEDEKKGQAKDPLFDGVTETFQLLESAYTAHELGNRIGVKAAIFNLVTSNIPRTFKAVAGIIKKSVPETYKWYDPRIFGVSLGRKAPNNLSTFVHEAGVASNVTAGLANIEVAVERLSVVFNPDVKPTLSSKEADFALTRAKYLGIQSLVNLGVGFVAGRVLRG